MTSVLDGMTRCCRWPPGFSGSWWPSTRGVLRNHLPNAQDRIPPAAPYWWISMTRRTVTDREIQAIVSLPPERRYEHFVKKAAENMEVWGLRYSDDRWAIGTSDHARESFPVWPDPRYAELMANRQWAGAVPHAIVLDDWLRKWSPGLARDGRLVAVFPCLTSEVALRPPEALASDIRSYLLDWYGDDA